MATKKKSKKKTKNQMVAMLSAEDLVKGLQRNRGRAPVIGAEAVFKRKLKKKKKNG